MPSSRRTVTFTRRELCGGLASVPLASPALAADRFDSVVRKSGGTHRSLAAALADAPASGRRWRILLGAGAWNEKLLVSRPDVELVGEDRERTILTASTASGSPKPGGGAWGTYGSATLTVEAPRFIARNLTIANGFDYFAALSAGFKDTQAVALTLGKGADRSLIHQVTLTGQQDTFYLQSGRALVRDCLITGSVDFIFGGAAARFERCEVRSRLRPGQAVQGFLAAPSTPQDQPVGLVFDQCRLTREAQVPNASAYLGRPWRAGGNMSLLPATAYLDCWMDAHIRPEGWTHMHYRAPGGPEHWLEPSEARFFEYRSRGPGAAANRTRRQLSPSDLPRYEQAAMFGGWRP